MDEFLERLARVAGQLERPVIGAAHIASAAEVDLLFFSAPGDQGVCRPRMTKFPFSRRGCHYDLVLGRHARVPPSLRMESSSKRAARSGPYFQRMPRGSGGRAIFGLLHSLYLSDDLDLVKDTRMLAIFGGLEEGFAKIALDIEILETACRQDPSKIIPAERNRLLGIYERLQALVAVQHVLHESRRLRESSLLRLDNPELKRFMERLENPMASTPDYYGRPRQPPL